MGERILAREEIRAGMLYLARLYLSYDSNPFPGPLRVCVIQPEEKHSQSFKPKGTLDGMQPPCWFALGCDAGNEVTVTVPELLGVLFSPDEEKLMLDLVAHQPCTATSVHERCKAVLGKSEFWSVWGQLQKRQLVEEGEDGRYLVAPEWLAKWLRRKAEKRNE